MGRSKAWLEVGETFLLQHIASTLARVCSRIVVVGTPGVELPPLDEDVLRVDDEAHTSHQGPLYGVGVGLSTLPRTTRVYLSGCDMPWIDASHATYMLNRLEQRPDIAACVPRTTTDEGKVLVHGLASALRCGPGLAAIERLQARGVSALKRLFDELPCERLDAKDLPDPEVLQDCNTPQAWHTALAHLAAKDAS